MGRVSPRQKEIFSKQQWYKVHKRTVWFYCKNYGDPDDAVIERSMQEVLQGILDGTIIINPDEEIEVAIFKQVCKRIVLSLSPWNSEQKDPVSSMSSNKSPEDRHHRKDSHPKLEQRDNTNYKGDSDLEDEIAKWVGNDPDLRNTVKHYLDSPGLRPSELARLLNISLVELHGRGKRLESIIKQRVGTK